MAAELGAALDFTSLLYARSRVVHAAASCGLDAIDVPYLDLDDEAGLALECRLVRDLGFTGKAAIHPRQLGPINAAFTPDAARIAYARKVIAAFETAKDGLVVVDGKLIELPVVRSARARLPSRRRPARREGTAWSQRRARSARSATGRPTGAASRTSRSATSTSTGPGGPSPRPTTPGSPSSTMNRHPLHFDREYARHTEFGQPIVNSALTLAVVTGMSVADVSQQAIANLGWTDIRMPAPVFNGDTLYAESEVLEKRESRSRPDPGHRDHRDPRLQGRRHAGHGVQAHHAGPQEGAQRRGPDRGRLNRRRCEGDRVLRYPRDTA